MADVVSGVVAPVAVPEVKTAQAPDPRLATYEKKERMIRKMQTDMQAEKAAWETERAKYSTDYVPKSRLTEDPLQVLEDMGMSYDQLTERILQRPNDPVTKSILAKLKAVEERQAATDKQATESQTKQYADAVKQIGNEVKMFVDSNESCETIKEMGMYEAVTELIEQTFNNEGYLMDIDKAAEEVENYLLEEAFKMSQLKKVQSRLQPKAPEVTGASKAKSPAVTTALRTITNNIPTQPSGRSTEKERIARAMAAFRGELK